MASGVHAEKCWGQGLADAHRPLCAEKGVTTPPQKVRALPLTGSQSSREVQTGAWDIPAWEGTPGEGQGGRTELAGRSRVAAEGAGQPGLGAAPALPAPFALCVSRAVAVSRSCVG